MGQPAAASPPINLIVLPTVGSTNEHAKQLARAGYPAGTAVLAQEQTAGKGRHGNTWTSPPGNLYMSLILRPELRALQIGQLSFLCALALFRCLRGVLPATADIGLKWPNDVLVEGRKCAGILLESASTGMQPVDWVVAGVGVNIAFAPEGAISVVQAGGNIDAPTLADRLLGEIMALYGEWLAQGFAPVRKGWMQAATRLGETIDVRLTRETLHGVFQGIDETGALLLGMPDGTQRTIASGEVYI